MKTHLFLSDLVQKYADRSGLSYQKIADRSQGWISKSTIHNWIAERSKRPRDWQSLVMFAHIVGLGAAETDELLQAGGHKPLAELQKKHTAEKDVELLAHWQRRDGIPYQQPQMDVRQFIGRESERETTLQALRTGQQLCAIVGLGGIGKTTLAIHVANQLHVHFPDGVLWARIKNLMDVLHAFAAAFDRDVSAESSLEARGSVVRGLLASKRVLIVLDNVESGDQLDVLLPKTRRCAVLITTRNRQVAANRPFVTVDLSPLNQAESVELLESYLGERRLRNEQVALTQLSLFVDGLPLALRVIGSTLAEVETLSLSEYVQELSSESSRLDHLADWTDASKNVRASFEVSYQRVPLAAQRVFKAVAGLGDGDFSADAVAHIAAVPLFQTKLLLGQLVAFSLLQKAEQNRFQLHPLLATFAVEKAHDQIITFQQNAIAYFLNYLATNQQEATYARLDDEWPHIATVLARLNETDRLTELCAAILALTTLQLGTIGYLDQRGRWRLALDYLHRAAPTLEETPFVQASLAVRQGAFAFRLAQFPACKTYFASYRILANELPPTVDSIMLNAHYSEFTARLSIQQHGDAESALFEIEQAINALAQLGDEVATHQQGYLQIVKGELLARSLGAFNEAITEIESGIKKLPQRPTSAELSGLNALAALYPQLGDLATSNRYCEQGAALADALGDQRRRAIFMMNRAINMQKAGDIAHADQLLQDALAIFQRIGDINEEGSVWVNIGMLRTIEGRNEAALEALEKAKTLGLQHLLAELTAYALVTMIRPNLAQNDIATARANLDQALRLCREHRLIPLMPLGMTYDGWLVALGGQWEEGLEKIDNGFELAMQGQALQDAGFARSLYAQLLDKAERHVDARNAHLEAIELLKEQDVYELRLAQSAYKKHLQIVKMAS